MEVDIIMSYWEDIQKSAKSITTTWTDFGIYNKYTGKVPDIVYKYIWIADDNNGKDESAIELNMKKINTIEREKVYLSDPKFFNDPYDTFAVYYDLKFLKNEAEKAGFTFNISSRLTDYVRVACFTGHDNKNMPMWGNYANNHKGFCLSYDMKDSYNIDLKSSLFPVEYTELRCDITDILKDGLKESQMCGSNDRIVHILNNISMYLNCLKHISWNHENEYRIVRFVDGGEFVDAKPNNIYIGLNCEERYENQLIEIARKMDIPLHKMKLNDFSLNFDLDDILI